MRTLALALVHFAVSAALFVVQALSAVPDYGIVISNRPPAGAEPEGVLFVLQLPLGPSLAAAGSAVGLGGLATLVAAVGNAVLWAMAVGALWNWAGRNDRAPGEG